MKENNMNLNELRDKAYQCAIAHGWHEEEHSDEHLLCLIISELMEAVQADRKGKRAKPDYYKTKIENSLICKGLDKTISKEIGYEVAYGEWIKDTVEDELADACIRLLDIAGLRKIEIEVLPMRLVDGVTFTEFCYELSGRISNQAKGNSIWLKNMIDHVIGLIFAWCAYNNIDILWHVKQKMMYNELRPYKHGNKIY